MKSTAGRGAELERLRQELRQRHDELWIAQTTIVDLMPEALQEFLDVASSVSSQRDLADWLAWAVAGLVERADRDHGPAAGTRIGEWRANCPLCGRGAFTPYSNGFAYPAGLKRHLAGTHGLRRCKVLAAAYWLSQDHIRYVEERSRPEFKGPLFSDRPKPWLQPPPSPPTSRSADVVQLRPTPVGQSSIE